jgi:hypothetical protein
LILVVREVGKGKDKISENACKQYDLYEYFHGVSC